MLSFFPRDVFGEIWDLIESVSEGFPTYFWPVIVDPDQTRQNTTFDTELQFLHHLKCH